jgi:hypothetical protein
LPLPLTLICSVWYVHMKGSRPQALRYWP